MDVKGLLIDLDGVLYVGDTAIAGAQAAVDWIKDQGYRFRFVSNTTRKCRSTIVKRLRRMGFTIDEATIFTPPLAAVAWMREAGKNRCMLLTTGDVNKDFEQWCENGGSSGPVDYVVVGDAGEDMTYENLTRALRFLNSGAGLIALEKDRFWMAPDGLALSAGPFVTALEFATGKSADVMGKPSPRFFGMALRDMGLSPDEAAMIGDDIITDIAGAKNAGMQAILVRTGKFTEAALDATAIKPDFVIDTIADLSEIL